jgi:two-component system sensor histidine kinase DegS
VAIKVDIQAGEERLPQNMEQHLFRIVQEACENSLRHAQAKNIIIFGVLIPQRVELTLEDDGAGFEPQLELSNLLANNHFGLAGMVERVRLIGAEIDIQSSPATGTKIHIGWSDGPDGD